MKTKPCLFLIILLTFSLALFTGGCELTGQTIKGDGNLERSSLRVADFHTIDLAGMFNVVLEPGQQAEVTLETDSNLMDLVSIESSNNVLRIKIERDVAIRPTRMDLHIVYPGLQKIIVGGACRISSPLMLQTPNMEFDLSGASSIELEMEVEEVITISAGASNLNFSGNARNHKLDLSGATNLEARNLITSKTDISLSGAGSARVHASEDLKASISGVGSIRYYGNPRHTDIDRSGIGSVRSAQ